MFLTVISNFLNGCNVFFAGLDRGCRRHEGRVTVDEVFSGGYPAQQGRQQLPKGVAFPAILE